tara:strand:+ start:1843 stop:2598 length:756 start_codon:yes stop_codon:yes gene_type:complete
MNNSIGGTNTPIVSINAGQPVTTSLAIAEGVGNTHKTVIQLIRQNISDLNDFGRVAFENAPFETAGGTQNREVATLNEQQSTLLLTYMRNNDVVRAFKKRLVKAFFEMRDSTAKNVDPIQALSDPATMRELLLGYSEKVLALESAVKEQAPKVAAYERISASDETLTITQAAKVLGVKRDHLTKYMAAKGWIYRQNKSWVAYKSQETAGRLVYKEAKYTDDNTGMEVHRPYCHLTQKGVAKLAVLLQEGSL